MRSEWEIVDKIDGLKKEIEFRETGSCRVAPTWQYMSSRSDYADINIDVLRTKVKLLEWILE